MMNFSISNLCRPIGNLHFGFVCLVVCLSLAFYPFLPFLSHLLKKCFFLATFKVSQQGSKLFGQVSLYANMPPSRRQWGEEVRVLPPGKDSRYPLGRGLGELQS
jgi:hypothetical protein